MPGELSVTHWIQQLPEGDRQGVQALWERYSRRLVGLARARLKGARGMIADEEDVALSAFDSVIRAVENQRFPKLDDRDDLWQLLVLVTKRKAANVFQYETRDKRDVRKTGSLQPTDSSTEGMEFKELISKDPDPGFAVMMTEVCQRLLELLPNAFLRTVALAKMEGCTNKEIATEHKCHETTVERKLNWIRDLWEQDRPE